MLLAILLAAPGLVILLVLAAAPLFQLWDDRVSERLARRGEDVPVAIPAPRAPVAPARGIPVTGTR